MANRGRPRKYLTPEDAMQSMEKQRARVRAQGRARQRIITENYALYQQYYAEELGKEEILKDDVQAVTETE